MMKLLCDGGVRRREMTGWRGRIPEIIIHLTVVMLGNTLPSVIDKVGRNRTQITEKFQSFSLNIIVLQAVISLERN